LTTTKTSHTTAIVGNSTNIHFDAAQAGIDHDKSWLIMTKIIQMFEKVANQDDAAQDGLSFCLL
jgi:hypothetical protein